MNAIAQISHAELRRRDHERALTDTRAVFRLPSAAGEPGTWAVESTSKPGWAHLVMDWTETGDELRVGCDDDCEGFTRRRTCIHVALVERRLIADGRLADPLAAPRYTPAEALRILNGDDDDYVFGTYGE